MTTTICLIKPVKAYPPPDNLRPGDFVFGKHYFHFPNFWEGGLGIRSKIKDYLEPHIIMYEKEESGVHYFCDSVWPAGVRKDMEASYFSKRYHNFSYHYVVEATQQNRVDAVLWAEEKHDSGIKYQLTLGGYDDRDTGFPYPMGWVNYDLYDPWDRQSKKIHCAELVWAAYMDATKDPIENQINIIDDSLEYLVRPGFSQTWWEYCVGVTIWDSKEFPDNTDVDSFQPDNPPFSQPYTMAIADCNLPADDPDNNKWTSIQAAVDNLSSHDILNIKSGTYSEDIVIDKSLIIKGEDIDSTIIEGSITMSNILDYELPDSGYSDPYKYVNMTGNELLMHFNNESEYGEDYLNSSTIYDHTRLGSNGTYNGATWNSSTLKGSGSFYFDGIDDFINLSSISALAGETVTLSSWICFS